MSNRQDKDRHQITKIAKCTIDTGNMQGNVVSRDFVENVLEFPFTSFEKLTGDEQKGGTSITGDLHTPLGAIHLTWYYSSSTRVFRNMRFLISPAPHCDMIIGAQSIQREKILSMPCLMGGNSQRSAPFFRTPTPEEQSTLLNTYALAVHGLTNSQAPEAKEKAKEKTQLQKIQHSLNDTVDQKVLEEGLTKTDPLYIALDKEIKVVGWILQLHKFPPHGLDNAEDEETAVWDNIIQHYPKISKNLSQALQQRLQTLRFDLGYKTEARNPWNEPTRADEWDDDIDYKELLKPSN
jgi:hypothetical protein